VDSAFTEADLASGETLVDEIPQSLLDALASAEVLRLATNQLNDTTRFANSQVSALAGRVTTLDFLINQQAPEDEDYIAPTQDDIAELPIRQKQLKSWSSCSVKLGRVSGLASWSAAPV
jgi:hypothetical protein